MEDFAGQLLAVLAILFAFACLSAHDSLAMLVDLEGEDCKEKIENLKNCLMF